MRTSSEERLGLTRVVEEFSQFCLHTNVFIVGRNEPCLLLLSQLSEALYKSYDMM